MAVAAQNAVRTIVNLSDVVKTSAAALTSQNNEAQVENLLVLRTRFVSIGSNQILVNVSYAGDGHSRCQGCCRCIVEFDPGH